jgi:hypothetical protein
MHETLSDFLFSTSRDMFSALICVVSILLWRIIRRKPLLQINKDERIESPAMFYVGIMILGTSSLYSFITGRPYSGIFLFLMLIFCILGLIAQKKGII